MDIGLFISTLKNSVGALSTIQSNEVLRERIIFIGEQIDILQKSHAATVEELAQTKAKCVELTNEIERYRAQEQFIQHMGAAFRKDASGEYARAVYCPNCFKAVGSFFDDFTFHCESCGWSSTFLGRDLDSVIKTLP